MLSNKELAETLREKDFKLRSFGVVLEFLLSRASRADRERVGFALFQLGMHTRGEKPLVFEFNGKEVKA